VDDHLAVRVIGAGARHDFKQVCLVRMNALVLEQPQQMEPAFLLAPGAHQGHPLAAFEERAVAQGVVNALQLLQNNATGAYVQMSDFTRPLVSFRQADCFSGGFQQRPGKCF
jgi:hypothetical protein